MMITTSIMETNMIQHVVAQADVNPRRQASTPKLLAPNKCNGSNGLRPAWRLTVINRALGEILTLPLEV